MYESYFHDFAPIGMHVAEFSSIRMRVAELESIGSAVAKVILPPAYDTIRVTLPKIFKVLYFYSTC